jgi:hypothetical protein
VVQSGDLRPDMVGRRLPDSSVREVGNSRERRSVFALGSLGAFGLDDGSASEVDHARDASVAERFRSLGAAESGNKSHTHPRTDGPHGLSLKHEPI